MIGRSTRLSGVSGSTQEGFKTNCPQLFIPLPAILQQWQDQKHKTTEDRPGPEGRIFCPPPPAQNTSSEFDFNFEMDDGRI